MLDITSIDDEVRFLTQYFDENFSEIIDQSKLETNFNRFGFFDKAMKIYVVIFILVLLSWLFKATNFNRMGYELMIVAFILHTIGIGLRMLLQDRPPVTNLYSSAIFVGWFSILMGIIFERINRNGLGNISAAIIGFVTLIIAHHLSLAGDTLEMMQAVLDTNIWLATHVVIITMGYGATIIAGIIAHVYIFKGIFAKSFDKQQRKNAYNMVFAANCAALLFMFIGTVLGGIWADQSWGRFWGWDPKENGALLIVLWLAIILHARIGGFIKERGMMVLSIISNIVTSFSWFGVNMLGIGLHSYGFMEKTFFWLMLFIFIQLFVIWFAFLPQKFWKSFN